MSMPGDIDHIAVYLCCLSHSQMVSSTAVGLGHAARQSSEDDALLEFCVCANNHQWTYLPT